MVCHNAELHTSLGWVQILSKLLHQDPRDDWQGHWLVEALGRIKQIWLSLLEEFEAFLKQFQQKATQPLEKFKAPAWQWMWFLRLQTGDKQLPLCFTLDCNQNFGQGQEWQLLNRFLSCSAINAWAYSQMHDNDSITALFAMNVISRASNWGQLSFCLTLGSKCNSWQGQEWQLLNRFLSCSATNSCVSDQMHDNDSITEHFPMNVIP